MAKDLADLKVCIFDVFGTAVDWRGSLIEDLPKLGKKYGLETDWNSFADDWRGLYQPQMGRVRKGELPWTRIDDLHKEAFEMLLKKRGLKHPGEEGAWEFTHLWHRLRPWPDSVEGIVPEFLTLLHGVLDSPDIPLNVSRSYLQSDSNVKKISQHITKKVADKLQEMFRKDRPDFEKKWDDINIFVKYGMISDDKSNVSVSCSL